MEPEVLIHHRSSYHYRADLHKGITLLCRLTGWITLIFRKLYMVYFNELQDYFIDISDTIIYTVHIV